MLLRNSRRIFARAQPKSTVGGTTHKSRVEVKLHAADLENDNDKILALQTKEIVEKILEEFDQKLDCEKIEKISCEIKVEEEKGSPIFLLIGLGATLMGTSNFSLKMKNVYIEINIYQKCF